MRLRLAYLAILFFLLASLARASTTYNPPSVQPVSVVTTVPVSIATTVPVSIATTVPVSLSAAVTANTYWAGNSGTLQPGYCDQHTNLNTVGVSTIVIATSASSKRTHICHVVLSVLAGVAPQIAWQTGTGSLGGACSATGTLMSFINLPASTALTPYSDGAGGGQDMFPDSPLNTNVCLNISGTSTSVSGYITWGIW